MWHELTGNTTQDKCVTVDEDLPLAWVVCCLSELATDGKLTTQELGNLVEDCLGDM